MARPRLGRLLAVAATLAVAVPAPADAHPHPDDIATFAGSGTLSKSVPLPPACEVDVGIQFSGTAMVVGDHGTPLSTSITFNGTGVECGATGYGEGDLSGGVTGNLSYERAGTTARFWGTVYINGVKHSIIDGFCQIVATSPNTFVIACSPVALHTDH